MHPDRPVLDHNQAPLRGRAVLLVEDEFMVALDAEQMLHDLGAARVDVASTFEAAERRVTDAALDVTLVVLDVNLNGKLSFPLAALVRQRGLPLVLTTGYELREQAGSFVFVGKPYTAQRLEDAIRRALAA